MTNAGYDRLNALKLIDEEKIDVIENFLNTNRQYVNDLTCCFSERYKSIEIFKFVPGHKAIILAIPTIIEKMSVAKTQAKTKPSHVTKSTTSSNSASIENEEIRSDEEVIGNLISNLSNYLRKCGFEIQDGLISGLNIQDFERIFNEDGFTCKCIFSCPFCAKIIPVRYKRFWLSSNITKHFKTKHM